MSRLRVPVGAGESCQIRHPESELSSRAFTCNLAREKIDSVPGGLVGREGAKLDGHERSIGPAPSDIPRRGLIRRAIDLVEHDFAQLQPTGRARYRDTTYRQDVPDGREA